MQATVEDLCRLDVNYLHHSGSLQDGAHDSVYWGRGGEAGVARVSFKDWRLLVRFHGVDGAFECQAYVLDQACRFGGVRHWFECPRCARAVQHLYLANTLACRRCYRLPYSSQLEPVHERAARKLRKVKRRLRADDPYNALEWFPGRPKGMHRTTFERLVERGDEAYDNVYSFIGGWRGRLNTYGAS